MTSSMQIRSIESFHKTFRKRSLYLAIQSVMVPLFQIFETKQMVGLSAILEVVGSIPRDTA